MPRLEVDVDIDLSKWDNFEADLPQALHDALQQLANEAVETAQQRAPVDTGALRASIGAIVEGLDALIFADIHYAFFVEFGTMYMAAQPFLMPAMDELQAKLAERIREAIEKVAQ